MSRHHPFPPVTGRPWSGLLHSVLIVAVILCCGTGARAQDPGKSETPPNVAAFLQLLADPGVQKWLEAHKSGQQTAPTPPPPASAVMLGDRVSDIRRHVGSVVMAIPQVPEEIRRARAMFMADTAGLSAAHLALLVVGFAILGFGVEWVYRQATARFAHAVAALPAGSTRERLVAIALRWAHSLGGVAAFAVGSIGAFLAFDWPPVLKEVALLFLFAILGVRVARTVLDVLLAPPSRHWPQGGAELRILPMNDAEALYWLKRLRIAIAIFAFGAAYAAAISHLGVSREARYVVVYALGLGLLAVGIEAIWRAAPKPAAAGRLRGVINPTVVRSLVTLYFIVLWGLWAAHAMPVFWLAVVAVALPAAIAKAQPSLDRLLRPAGADDAAPRQPSILEVCLERGVRMALIAAAVLLLAWAWSIDLVAMTQADSLLVSMLRGLMSVVIILLIADFVWHVARTAIDNQIAGAQRSAEPGAADMRQRARLRTLLPIVRMFLLVVVLTVAVLTALASIGVQIAPLIASAGVVGVAVGFGSQTLVRDILSGVFYLMDDAFSVGDYIVSGSYKGTVESFSLRSVKLRHHRGAVYTVPFGVLGAVQNQSRDWVIEKITLGITYDSDIEKARKLIKKVGIELAEDPEYKASIIEPLKMQGVESFGDYAIQLRLKMMTKPQEQFVVKRKAMARIKTAFEQNGIKFAYPVVQVAGDAGSAAATAAAAQRVVSAPKAAAE
jgi:moderate conductance mechanosensitive channel